MKIRTIIVDDEALARDRLRQLLRNESAVEIAGECADGREAVALIKSARPDLVFLDVQMPELDGFGVLREIGIENAPVIVFVTAHDEFALRAFDVHAVDYLLKPFDRERFARALHRALERVAQRGQGGEMARHAALLAELKSPGRIAVKSGAHTVWLDLDEVDWIESADNYVELHVGCKSHLLRETMSALEGRLTPSKFLRISRSVIVNAKRVRESRRMLSGGYQLTLEGGARLTVSRRYRDKLKALRLE